jgi:hypothetical protein
MYVWFFNMHFYSQNLQLNLFDFHFILKILTSLYFLYLQYLKVRLSSVVSIIKGSRVLSCPSLVLKSLLTVLRIL